MTTHDELPAPPAPNDEPPHGRFTSEVMAGGAVVEKADDELVGGWRGAFGVLGVVALIALLGLFSLWWLVFVIGVLIAIFLHELGHFSTARWTGMKATQFFIGFGPRVWSFRRGETEYGIRALPLGAFVRIIGMNSMDEVAPEDEGRTYRSKSFPKRLLVISAGSIMHMLLAIVLLFTVYVADGEVVQRDGAEIGIVEQTGPAFVAGIQPDDVVLSIDGEAVESSVDLGRIVQSNEPQEVLTFEVLRDGREIFVPVALGANTDEESPLFGKPYIGVSSGTYYETIEHSTGAAAVNAVTDIFPTSWEMTKGAVKVLNPVNIFTHLAGTNEDLETRPTTLVGVTGLSDDVGESQGLIGILFLLAVLNVFIGVFNMFPLLPLDGGHAAIATYERLREGRSRQRYYADVAKMMPFAMAVMTVLLFLFMSGLYLDITDPVG
ncbi:MAG: site-2 protease family protein [Ilumatobacter sp.]|uniref:M50 family metallopeptidase n=1 Tax=Ilumatobacter sp. TaxID=1967498 RepID=UPI00261FEE97|nr:site-2 protease family protein [Ilumatobacter sp.]MDJ0768599.1 site-2 protease family protein [Ilumatobacter sp.]